MNFNFNSKETYLEQRAQWKAEYLQLIQDIRKAKIDIKEAQRALSKAPPHKYERGYDNKPYYAACSALSSALSSKYELSSTATKMLTDLANARLEAGRQMEAARLART